MATSEDDVAMSSAQKKEATLPVGKDWLVDIINDKSGAKGILKGFECRTIGDGQGFFSVITRVTLHWEEDNSEGLDELPKGVVIKKPTLDKQSNSPTFKIQQLIEMHNRECKTYAYLLNHPPAPIPMARFFYAAEIEKEGGGLLILEDLTETTRSIAFFKEETTVEQVLALAGHMARLQAYGLTHPDYMDYIQPMPGNPYDVMFQKLDKSLDIVQEKFPGKFPWTSEEFRKLYDERVDRIQMFGLPSELEYTKVLSLGDVQPNNILWYRCGPSNEDTTADVAAFLDFQVFHIGNCMNDIANPIAFGLSTEVRRQNTDAIIDHYLKCLREQFQLARGGGDESVPVIPFVPVTREEALRVHLEMMFQYATLGLCMVPLFETALATMLTPELREQFIDRNIACLQDALVGLEKCNIMEFMCPALL